MANKTKALETLEQYFKEKGRVLTVQEYSRETDTPIRLQQLRNIFGSWNRVEKLLMARRLLDDEVITDIDDVIAARNKAAADAEALWKAAREDQNKKAEREAEAMAVAEKLALNAATPEGANANKIAIGGPLADEQPAFETLGATVEIDPVTMERTVVDVNPEEIEASTETGKEPEALKEEADPKDGKVSTGSATKTTKK